MVVLKEKLLFVDVVQDETKMLEVQSALGQRIAETFGLPFVEQRQAVEGITDEILRWLHGWTAISKRSVFAIGGMLYWVERYWSALAPLHATYQAFDEFARQETELQYSTYRAWIAIYKTYILNEPKNPMVVAKGPDAFLEVPVGKLERAVAKVRRNEMDQHHWDAMFDEQVSDREFYHTISTNAEEHEQDQKDFVEGKAPPAVRMNENGDILLWRGGISVRVGWVDTISQDAEVREAVDKLVLRAGLRD